MSANVSDYADFRDSFARWDLAIAPAELHGNLCGVMCGGGDEAADRWVGEIVSEHAEHDPQNAEQLRDALRSLVAATSRDLGGAQLAFEPLLPDDDAALDEQVDALAAYCHGFLAGLALGGATQQQASADVAEVLVDFAEISRACADEDALADRDTADFALAQIKEYVRVGVQLTFEELRGRHEAAADRSDVTH